MTTIDDPIQGCYKFLRSFSDVLAVLGSTTNPDHSVTPWIFTDKNYKMISGTQGCAIVVSGAGGWAGPSNQSTAEFPRVQIDIYSDPPRDSSLNVVSPVAARTQAYNVYRYVDRHLHVPYVGVLQMGTCLVFGSIRLGHPIWLQPPTDDKVGKLTVYYGLSTAEFFTS